MWKLNVYIYIYEFNSLYVWLPQLMADHNMKFETEIYMENAQP